MATGAALDCLFAICIQGDVLVPESEQKANNELLTFVYFCRILSLFVAFWSLRTETRPSSKASDSRQMK
jgi:hypothetical protein